VYCLLDLFENNEWITTSSSLSPVRMSRDQSIETSNYSPHHHPSQADTMMSYYPSEAFQESQHHRNSFDNTTYSLSNPSLLPNDDHLLYNQEIENAEDDEEADLQVQMDQEAIDCLPCMAWKETKAFLHSLLANEIRIFFHGLTTNKAVPLRFNNCKLLNISFHCRDNPLCEVSPHQTSIHHQPSSSSYQNHHLTIERIHQRIFFPPRIQSSNPLSSSTMDGQGYPHNSNGNSINTNKQHYSHTSRYHPIGQVQFPSIPFQSPDVITPPSTASVAPSGQKEINLSCQTILLLADPEIITTTLSSMNSFNTANPTVIAVTNNNSNINTTNSSTNNLVGTGGGNIQPAIKHPITVEDGQPSGQHSNATPTSNSNTVPTSSSSSISTVTASVSAAHAPTVATTAKKAGESLLGSRIQVSISFVNFISRY
jgi:hypothetical protein